MTIFLFSSIPIQAERLSLSHFDFILDGQREDFAPWVSTFSFSDEEEDWQVTHLLKFLDSTSLFHQISAMSLGSGRWQISAERNRSLVDLSLKGVPRYIRYYLGKRRFYLGRHVSIWEIFLDTLLIRSQLRDIGYTSAEIEKMDFIGQENNTYVLEYRIQLGPLCHIQTIHYLRDYESDLSDLIQSKGAYCSQKRLQNLIEEYLIKIKKRGFLNSKLHRFDLKIDDTQKSGVLEIDIEKGPLFEILVVEVPTSKTINILTERQTGYMTQSLLDSMALQSMEEIEQVVRQHYLNRGYRDFEILNVQNTEYPDRKSIKFFIHPHKFYFLKEIQFSESLPFGSSVLLEALGFERKLFQTHIPFLESNYQKITARLLSFLVSKGYLQAQIYGVTKKYVSSSQGVGVEIFVELSLGTLSILKEVEVLIHEPWKTQLKRSPFLEFPLNRTFSPSLLRDFDVFVEDYLLQNGLVFEKVQSDWSFVEPASSDVKVTIHVDLAPVLKVGRTLIETVLVGKEEKLIEFSGLKTGKILTLGLLDQAKRALMSTGLFSYVDIKPIKREETASLDGSHYVDVMIQTKPKDRMILSFRPSYGSYTGYEFNSQFLFHQINTGGGFVSIRGAFFEDKQVRLLEQEDFLGRKIGILLSEPFALWDKRVTPYTWTVETDYESRASDWGRYRRTLENLSLSRYFWLGNRLGRFSFGGGGESIVNSSKEKILLSLFEHIDPVTTNVHVKLSLDNRDSLAWPRFGGIHAFMLEQSFYTLSSLTGFYRFMYDFETFLSVPDSLWTYVLLGGVGILNSPKGVLLPSHMKRFLLDGKSMLRGFPTGSLRPGPFLLFRTKSLVNLLSIPRWGYQVRSLSATHLLYFKQEVRYRLPIYSRNLIVGGVFFLDTGGVFFRSYQVSHLQNLNLQDKNLVFFNGETVVDLKIIGLNSVKSPLDLVRFYWRYAYISTGVGVRFVIPNVLRAEIDWGFPIRDPIAFQQDPIVDTYLNYRRHSSMSVLWISDQLGYRLPGMLHLNVTAIF